MRYLLALILPPLAILLSGKIFQALFNGVFFVIGIVFFLLGGGFLSFLCILHAIFVVHGHNQDRRTKEIVRAIKDRD